MNHKRPLGRSRIDTEQFGVHLMIDGYDASPDRLRDAGLLRALLAYLPDHLGMHRICEPVLVEVGPKNRKDPGGFSGFVMVAESHFSFHTFPARGFVTLDVYTCQNNLDTKSITALLATTLAMNDMDIFVQPRGLRYPLAHCKNGRPGPDPTDAAP